MQHLKPSHVPQKEARHDGSKEVSEEEEEEEEEERSGDDRDDTTRNWDETKEKKKKKKKKQTRHKRPHSRYNESVIRKANKEATLWKYLQHTFLPGSISCLEWWAIEILTLLAGGLRFKDDDVIAIFFVHGCWNSLLVVFQMPSLGLSVAMAALTTDYIKNGSFHAAWLSKK
ncbi:hypothetical protein RFI_28005 [Reticulomyxa filosa]|uniref:Uncharacterized protein n=1 Tax=Reticulomyxa filosa TaxID=46433 RepID=X6M7G3_RETFI|nr:hypothetical protein RFI_28005 [Reticulomyxa filosa]|eukprot:ETO09372.1 hypothetical protein RFI_28005 [Reticulomyxa filosa]